jgi:G:T/U-mismatch repair DNA glycosylase
MAASSSRPRIAALGAVVVVLLAAAAALLVPKMQSATAQDLNEALHKANTYIEVASYTDRALDSWDRYASWVNLKTGPTGKERYISYGMYSVPDLSALMKEARASDGRKPRSAKLDALMKRYIDSYEALAPVINRADAYYERKAYTADDMAEGRKLHTQMLPLIKTFQTEREAMMQELRPFVRGVEELELNAIEKRDGGRSQAWHAASVMLAASRVVDVFPRKRPTPVSPDALDDMIKSLGPNTPAAKFEEIMSGVQRPTDIQIDMKRFAAALKAYAEAVDVFDRFAAEKPDGMRKFKDQPRRLLNALRRLEGPLIQSKGRDFENSDPIVGGVVQTYFDMISTSSDVSRSQVRFLQ